MALDQTRRTIASLPTPRRASRGSPTRASPSSASSLACPSKRRSSRGAPRPRATISGTGRTASATTIRCGATPHTRPHRGQDASSRRRRSSSRSTDRSAATSGGCRACTRCSRGSTSPGIARCCSATEFTTKAWLKDLVEHQTRFAGRSIQQIYRCEFYRRGRRTGRRRAIAGAFAPSATPRASSGTKYDEVKKKAPVHYSRDDLAKIFALYEAEEIRGAKPALSSRT